MPDDTNETLSQLRVVQYSDYISLTILLWEYLVTFDNEVEYIWKSRWGLGKILFLISRYPTLAVILIILYLRSTTIDGVDFCTTLMASSLWFTTLCTLASEAILVLRTCAVWRCKKYVVFSLLFLYMGVCVPSVVIVHKYVRSLRFGADPNTSVKGCYTTSSSSIISVNYILVMSFETVILSLTLYQFFKEFRYCHTPLVYTLYRDGVLYFVYIFLISVSNIVILLAGDAQLDPFLSAQVVLHSTFSARIMLHLRKAARHASQSGYFTQTQAQTLLFALEDDLPHLGRSASIGADVAELPDWRAQPSG